MQHVSVFEMLGTPENPIACQVLIAPMLHTTFLSADSYWSSDDASDFVQCSACVVNNVYEQNLL